MQVAQKNQKILNYGGVPALGIQGGILQDFSGNGNLGTLVNMDPLTDWVGVNDSRIPGYALKFDASDDIVEIDDDPTISVMNALTLSTWVNPRATSQLSGSRIIAKSDSGTGDDYALGYSSNATTKIRFRVRTGIQNNLDNSDSIPLNSWTHVVGTYDGTIMRVYYDAVEKNTLAASGSLATSNEKLTLASHASTPTNRRFDGQIAEVRIYNRALSQEEVLADFINPLATFGLRNQVFSLVATPPIVTSNLLNYISRVKGKTTLIHK